jgi:hypothetical protein
MKGSPTLPKLQDSSYSNGHFTGKHNSMVGAKFATEWTVKAQSMAGVEDFSFILCVQTGCRTLWVSCAMGIRDPFRKEGSVARAWCWPLIPCLVPRLRKSRNYTSSSPKCLHDV